MTINVINDIKKIHYFTKKDNLNNKWDLSIIQLGHQDSHNHAA